MSSTISAVEQDELLFRELEQKKKKKKRRIIRTVVIILLIAAVGLMFGVSFLRKKVMHSVAGDDNEVISFEAKLGSVNTTVSGYGTLANVDEEELEIPAGVKIIEVTVDANETVAKGEVIATIEPASVLDAMKTLEEDIAEIDRQLEEAEDENALAYVKSGVSGRIKKIYAEAGENVTDCLYDHGALAILSLDGYMACSFESDSLSLGDSVTVKYGGRSENGSVARVVDGEATVILSDALAGYGEKAEIFSADEEKVGEATVYVHSPLRIIGTAGTVSSVHVKENDGVSNGSVLFSLQNTEYAATYDYLMKQRREMEEDLLTLNELYRDGAVLAPYAGTVTSVNYNEDAAKTTTTVTYYDNYSAASTVDNSKEAVSVVTMSPDREVNATISVDEANILSLKVGQKAEITISSIGEDTFEGTLTEINKTGTSSSGVTRYAAVVTLAKTPEMLTGMTASVVIHIQGVDNAVIIPVDALHQTSTTSFVYTSYDEENMQYGGLKEVTTGISNSSYVEITGGLSAGEKVYYVEEEESFSPFGMPGNFGGGMPGSGNFSGGMPGGGNFSGSMPGGGNFSGGMPGGGNFSGRQGGGRG